MLCVENLCNDDAEEAIVVDMLTKNIALGKENENCVVLVGRCFLLCHFHLPDCMPQNNTAQKDINSQHRFNQDLPQ